MLRPRYNKRRYRGMREDGEVSVEYKKRTRSDAWGMGQKSTYGGIRERMKVRTTGGTGNTYTSSAVSTQKHCDGNA